MTSSAIQLVNDRPTAINDDLYQWAVDAEQMLRDQAKIIEMAYRLAQKFRNKVHIGTARSTETYDECTQLVKAITKEFL